MIYDEAKAKMDAAEIDNHCSDLYLKKTPISDALVAAYEFKQNVTTFRSQIDSTWWYEIPFAYYPYMEERNKA